MAWGVALGYYCPGSGYSFPPCCNFWGQAMKSHIRSDGSDESKSWIKRL